MGRDDGYIGQQIERTVDRGTLDRVFSQVKQNRVVARSSILILDLPFTLMQKYSIQSPLDLPSMTLNFAFQKPRANQHALVT